eukprot:2498404-Alexandrium_andersonii.AAC.1
MCIRDSQPRSRLSLGSYWFRPNSIRVSVQTTYCVSPDSVRAQSGVGPVSVAVQFGLRPEWA